ncbi:MAG: hypothetical protein LBO20_00445 [Bifidobacteriaceae bacterium]|jgi:hypothetical protein|nr:hypothetical protein [Bifidobacteriaceae bacterium]
MRKAVLVRRINRAAAISGIAWGLTRRGANHDVYRLGDLVIPVPRHQEINDRTAERIFKECEPQLGPRWWRAK